MNSVKPGDILFCLACGADYAEALKEIWPGDILYVGDWKGLQQPLIGGRPMRCECGEKIWPDERNLRRPIKWREWL